MYDGGEYLITDLVKYISTKTPIDVERTKNELSLLMSDYHTTRVEETETHPDLNDKIDLFLNTKTLEGSSTKTIKGYDLELHLFSKRITKKAENITSADIRTYLGELKGIQMSTMGRKLYVLKSFFGWLKEEEYIGRDPTAKLKAPKTKKGLPKSLKIEELEMLRESCETIRQRALVEVLYSTGCRLSEIVNLNKGDINYQEMSARVLGKGNKERLVFLSHKAMYHLSKYLNTRHDDCESLFVTLRKPYRRPKNRTVQREVDIIAENAQIKTKVSPHIFRHTFATLTLNNGAEIVAVQELLGHTSPDTTLRYARITEERKREQHKKYLVM
ncbi:site-specific tyrosine recombinase/integron integrase [Bacillus sp. 2205SS5-2]|uniref:site-specific tyrosine recombinase/integron integrase n=1 Tax=Bacillus sp. 2205SS5-2 TaxID=3109031 RepID=UPI00300616B2